MFSFSGSCSLVTAFYQRAVLFVGHQFNRKISFFSGLELENAVVASSASDEATVAGKGGISMEQAFIKFNPNSRMYLMAGLFVRKYETILAGAYQELNRLFIV